MLQEVRDCGLGDAAQFPQGECGVLTDLRGRVRERAASPVSDEPSVTAVRRLGLAAGNGAAQAAAEQRLSGTVNYFIGNDPSRWHVGVPTYARITYPDAYPGVDLVYYGTSYYDGTNPPDDYPMSAAWHVYMGQNLAATTAGSSFAQYQASPVNHRPSRLPVFPGFSAQRCRHKRRFPSRPVGETALRSLPEPERQRSKGKPG